LTRETWIDELEEEAKRKYMMYGDREQCFSAAGQRGNRADGNVRIAVRAAERRLDQGPPNYYLGYKSIPASIPPLKIASGEPFRTDLAPEVTAWLEKEKQLTDEMY
jgi:hypothetical protein